MYKITVPSKHSFEAIRWASKTFNNEFDVKLSPNDWSYVFGFKDPQAATLFALKWT